MALVSRRTLQRLIRENAAFTTLAQRERQVAALNRANVESLSTEWEILVLNGLSRLASISHEAAIGTRFPDVLAHINAGETVETFVADITTVFSNANDELNPIDDFSQDLRGRGEKMGLTNCHLQIDARGSKHGQPRKQRMKLKVPAKKDFPTVFEQFIRPFFTLCVMSPTRPRETTVVTDQFDFTIGYRPGRNTTGMSYPSYTTNYSVTHNTIFNALKGKAAQLRGTEFTGPRGVILCGADVDLSRRQTVFGVEAITDELFRQNKSVAFVLSLWVPQRRSGVTPYKTDLYENQAAAHRLGTASRSALMGLAGLLPEPLEDGLNAVNQLDFRRWTKGYYFYGWKRESRYMVEISARVLMQYLAGQIDRNGFLEALNDNGKVVPVFERRLKYGQLLTNITFRREPDRDDDWVVFHFGEPDPAMAPIKAE
jgi:hypothetical protein